MQSDIMYYFTLLCFFSSSEKKVQLVFILDQALNFCFTDEFAKLLPTFLRQKGESNQRCRNSSV